MNSFEPFQPFEDIDKMILLQLEYRNWSICKDSILNERVLFSVLSCIFERVGFLLLAWMSDHRMFLLSIFDILLSTTNSGVSISLVHAHDPVSLGECYGDFHFHKENAIAYL
jgi:hypothetical protein